MGEPEDIFKELEAALRQNLDDTAVSQQASELIVLLSGVDDPLEAGHAALSLGDGLQERASQFSRPVLLYQAQTAYSLGIEIIGNDRPGDLWHRLMTHRANAAQRSATISGDVERFDDSIADYTAVLENLASNPHPLAQAMVTSNRASSYRLKSNVNGDLSQLDRAIEDLCASRDALCDTLYVSERCLATIGLAQAYCQRGQANGCIADFRSAIDLFSDAIEHNDDIPKKDVAMALNGRAIAHFRFGELSVDETAFALAIENHQLAIEIYKEIGPLIDLARCLIGLGNVYIRLAEAGGSLSHYDAAVACYEEARAYFDKNTYPWDWSTSSIAMGNALIRMGELTADTALLEKGQLSIEEATQIIDPERAPAEWATQQVNIGIAEQMIGLLKADPDKVFSALQRYNALEKNTGSMKPTELARFFTVKGIALKRIGDLSGDPEKFIESADSYRISLEYIDQVQSPLEYGRVLKNLGNVLTSLGELTLESRPVEEALSHFNAARDLHPVDKAPMEWASAGANMGVAYGILGELSGDAEMFDQAVNCYQATLEHHKRDVHSALHCQTVNSLGSSMVRKGRLLSSTQLIIKGIEHLEKAREIADEISDDHNKAAITANLANAYEDVYDLLKDETYLELSAVSAKAAIALYTQEKVPVYHLAVAKQFGRVLMKQGKFDDAIKLLEPLLPAAIESVLSEPGYERHNLLLRRAGGLSELLAWLLIEKGAFADAITALDKGRAVSLGQALRERTLSLEAVRNAQSWRAVQAAVKEFDTFLPGISVEAQKRRIKNRAEAVAKLSTIHQSLKHSRQKEVSISGAELISELRDSLPDGGILVALTVSDLGAAALLVDKGGDDIDAVHLPRLTERNLAALIGDTTRASVPASQREDWVKAYATYSNSLQKNAGVLSDKTRLLWSDALDRILEKLSHICMQDLHDALKARGLPAGTEVIFVIPGRFGPLPIAATPIKSKQGKYFCDHWAVSMAPSIEAYVTARCQLHERQSQSPSLLAVTDPGGDVGVTVNPAIVAFDKEKVTNIAGTAATLSTVVERISDHTHFSFYCHGTRSGFNPDDAGLELANGDRLTVGLLRTLNTNAAQLAVLAACETGIIDLRNTPDEFVGLPSSFMEAGIPTVVSTLWPVSASDTAQFVEGLFRHLAAGATPAKALRRTQREFIRLATGEKTNATDGVTLGFRKIRNSHRKENNLRSDIWRAFIITGA